jgi:hypothetical protein
MKNDPVLRMLKDLRTEVIHQRPVNLRVNSGPKFHENPITTTYLEITNTSDPDGNIIWRYRVGQDGEERRAEPVTDWEFEKNGTSVLAVCHQGLAEVDKLLRSRNDLFGIAVRDQGTGETDGSGITSRPGGAGCF